MTRYTPLYESQLHPSDVTRPSLPHQRFSNQISWFCLGLFLLQFIPFLLMGEGAYIRIHDTLEGEWFWYHQLWESGQVFNFSPDATLDTIMNGLPRRTMPSGLTFMSLLVGSLGLYWGYLINYLVVHSVAFVGMYLLLKKFYLIRPSQTYLVLAVALCFSWLPLFNTFGITVAGQPMLLYCWLSILRDRGRYWHYGFTLLFPFYTNIVWAFIPAVCMGGICFLYHWYKSDWRLKWQFLTLLTGMVAAYLVINFQLFELLLTPGDFISHRESYNYLYNKNLDFNFSLKHTMMVFFIGHYHVGTLVSVPIFFALLYTLLTTQLRQRTYFTIIALVGISLFYGFYNWIVHLGGETFPLLETFKFERIRILMPLLWFLLLALLLQRLSSNRGNQWVILIFLAGQFICCAAANDEFQHNVRHLAGRVKLPTYPAYFSTNLFQDIHDYIDQPPADYRVVHLGIHPSVSLYNGFYTLDSHQSIYELNYKKTFGAAMQMELQKDQVIYNEFNLWGNRCYLYSAELGKEGMAFMHGKHKGTVVQDLQLDVQVLKDLGASYLFSAVAIANADKIGLELEKIFENETDFWRIHLYRLNTYEESTSDLSH